MQQQSETGHVTPELALDTPVGHGKLFPVFRRRGDYKVRCAPIRLPCLVIVPGLLCHMLHASKVWVSNVGAMVC